MDNYYEKLGVPSSAPAAQIQTLIDTQYNQVRRLVNHHDPSIVNQANQALVVLEQMRATLLDEGRRAAYDSSMGFGSPSIGGVADPSLAGQAPAVQQAAVNPALVGFGGTANPVYPVSRPMQAAVPVVSGWTCQSCSTVNPPGTMFCTSCGKEVGRVCPNCQGSYEARARFCPSCGLPYESAVRKSEVTNRMTKLRTERFQLEGQANATSSMDLRSIQFLWVVGGGWAFLTGLTGILFILAAIFRLIFRFVPWDIINADWMRVILQIFSFLFGLVRWGIFGGMLAGFFLYLEKRRGIKADRIALAVLGGAGLFATLISGPNFYQQITRQSVNSWLVLPALVAGGLFLWAGVSLSQNREATQSLALPVAALRPYQQYVDRAAGLLQKSPWLLAGAGAGLSLALLIFSLGSPIFSIIAAVIGMVTGLLLYVVANRAWSLQDIQRETFENRRREAQARLAALDAETAALEGEMNVLTAASVRR